MKKLLFCLMFLFVIITVLQAATMSSSSLSSLLSSSKSDAEDSGNEDSNQASDKTNASDSDDASEDKSDSGSSNASSKKAVINFVSTDKFTQGPDYRVGSLAGNVILYLKGSGLSSDITATQVLIGKSECVIEPAYTSNIQIACRVPAASSYGSQDITVRISKKKATCDTTICTFKYDASRTPVVMYVVPTAINPNTNIKIGGVYRVPDSSYLTINLNQYLCNNEVIGKQTLDANNLGFVKCAVGPLPSGYYDTKVTVASRGDAIYLNTAYNLPDSKDLLHNLTVVPQITSLSSHIGTTAGQVLTITGNGFSDVRADNQINFGDTPCVVMSSSYTSIQCHLIRPSIITQIGLKPGHAGLKRRSFGLTSTISDLLNSQQFLQNGGTKSVLLTAETEYDRSEDFSEALEGFFKAPVTGTYRFMLSAQGPAQLHVSQTPYTKDRLTLAAEIKVGSGFRDFYDVEEKQISGPFTLEQGQYYYLQAVHLGSVQEHLTIGVIVPNNGERKHNSLRKILSVKVDAEVVMQTGIFKITKPSVSSTLIQFSVRQRSTTTKSTGFTFPGGNSDVEAQMSQLGFPIQVTGRSLYDINKNLITDPTQASRATEVRYKFTYLTTSSVTSATKPTGTYVEVTLDNTPTTLVQGSFELALLGKTFTVNFDQTADSLKDLLLTIPGVGMPRVARYGACAKGCEWIIQFDGNKEDIPKIQVISKGTLSGGKAEKLGVSVTVIQDCSNDLFYAPIPNDMLFTAETTPQITLKTKGIQASCPSFQCNYQVIEAPTPTITSFTLTGDTLEIFVRDGETLTELNVNVFFANVEAGVISYDAVAQKIVAKIPPNDAGQPRIVAGTHIPVALMENNKMLKVASDLAGKTIYPVITKVEVDISSMKQGFLGFRISGSGFGYSLADSYGTRVSIAGIPCQLSILANSWAFCTLSEVLRSGQVDLTVNGLSTNYPFQINLPPPFEIVSRTVDPSSSENIFVMHGEDFDETTEIIFYHKETWASMYCAVCSWTQTTIQCRTNFLPPGEYTVVANTIVTEAISQQSTSYLAEFQIDSVEPQFGSHAGGTVLTIQGKGFASIVNDNQVSFGSMNYRCTVLEATETMIKCSTAANAYEVPENEPQTVNVLQRLEYVADCQGICQFSYSDAHTPTITSLSHIDILADDHLTIFGRGFTQNSKITISGVVAEVVSVADEEIVVEVPEISAGLGLQIKGYDTVYGTFAVPDSIFVNHALKVADFSPKIGSAAGTILTITGKGFSSNTYVNVGTSTCQVLTVSASLLTCRTAANSQGAVVVNEGIFKVTTDTAFSTQAASTPTINSISGLPITVAVSPLTVTFQGQALNIANPVKVTLKSSKLTFEGQVVSADATTIQVQFINLSAGSYELIVQVGDFIAKFDTDSGYTGVVEVPLNVNAVTTVPSSFAGGVQLEITGSGFTDNTKALSLKIEGFSCPIVSASFDRIVCAVPPLITENTQSTYQFGEEALLKGKYFSSGTNENPSQVFDNTTVTYFTASSTPTDCFFGVDFGQDLFAKLTQIQFSPRVGMDLTRLAGSVFEGSVDNVNYVTLYTVGTNVYDGWNTIASPMEGQSVLGFRYLRFRKNTALSRCEIAEVRVKGILFSSLVSQDSTVVQASARLSVNGKSVVIPNAVEYRADKTPVITSLEPKMGSSKGNTELTLFGQNLGLTSEVKIDNVACQITSVTDNQIVCRTGALPPVSQRTERVRGLINAFATGQGKISAKGVSFLYAEKWSDKDTWGCGGLPREYDSVHVETGMNLLVDVSPPRLVAVVVEGALIFPDGNDINFEAEYVLIRNGILQIGTESEPIQNNIQITLYGSKTDPQLPIFGNRVIGLYEGVIDIHGKARVNSATLAVTAEAGQNSIEVKETVDWKEGDRIVIGSTSKDANENEERIIVSVTGNTIFLNNPLEYTHLYRQSEPIDGQVYEVNTQVVLLSRNIVIQGDADSDDYNYGAHLLFYDPGTESTIVRISNTEITKAGQAGFLGRFPINFQHAGVQMRSYVKGNSIHNTYQRGIQLQGTHYLTVSSNVIFNARGYGINLEDGIERFNVFEDNIVMSCRSTLQYLSTQENSIGYRISNPTNFFRRNQAIGNPSYGFWFDLKSNTAGAYSSQRICPSGEKLGAFENNVAAWNTNDGIKFDTYIPRTYSCRQVQYNNQVDPFALNRPVSAVFKSNLVLGNKYRGINAYSIGAVVFDQLKAVENGLSGIELYFTEQAPISTTVILNSVFIGSTLGQNPTSNKGISLPRSEGLSIENAVFANYATGAAMEIDAAYYSNSYFDSGARTVFVKGLKFVSVTFKAKFSNGATHIFRDLDGSLTGIQNGGTLVNNLPHLQGITGCFPDSFTDGGLSCDSNTEFRRVALYEVSPNTIYGSALKVLRLSNTVEESDRADSEYTSHSYRYGRAPTQSYALPYALGYSYKVFFDGGFDYVSLAAELSPHWVSGDLLVTLVFNHTAAREDYDLSRWDRIGGTTNVENSTQLWDLYQPNNVVGKSFGDWHHDFDHQRLYVALLGGSGTVLKVKGYSCRVNCPTPPPSPILEKKTVYWSDITIWSGQTLPKEWDSVIVPWDWILILDINPPSLTYIEIQGELRFYSNRQQNVLKAKKIWVRGTLTIGSEFDAFENGKIVLLGTREESSLVVNNGVDAGTKVLVVTGELSIYGKKVTERVGLVTSIHPGDTTINVNGDISGWLPGHLIALTSSKNEDDAYEILEIEHVLENGVIQVKTGARFFHYAGLFQSTVEGLTHQVDFTSQVVLLNRTVQIEGSKEDNWGGRILVTDEYYDDYTATGKVTMQYVQLDYVGQHADKAAISFETMSNVIEGAYSVVLGSVIVDCLAWGVKFSAAQNIKFQHNVIVKTRQFGIFFYENNADIEVSTTYILSTVLEANVIYTFLEGVSSGIYLSDLSSNTVAIAQNVVGGSQVAYTLKASACSTNNPYSENVAHSSTVGFLILTNSDQCSQISDLTAYRNSFGVLSYFGANKITAKNLILTDNKVSLNLNAVGKDQDQKLVKVQDSFFAAFALTDCPECYELETSCKQNTAIMLGVATQEGKQMPPRIQDRPWEAVQSFATFNSQQVFTNNVFINFKEGLLAKCGSNSILRTNKYASDYTPYATLSSSHLLHVDEESLAYFDVAEAEERCGNMPCTGLNNVLIKDTDGTFIGTKGSILPNNPDVVNKNTCTYRETMNGYICRDEESFAILGFESLDTDKLTRVVSPVYISNTDGFSNTLNAFKAHDYFTGHLFERLGRFASIIQKNKAYIVQFSGTPPSNLKFQIEGANREDYAILRVKYYDSQVIAVYDANTNEPIHPVRAEFDKVAAIKDSDPCGANYFDRQQRIINFKLTADPNCKLYVKKTNVLAVNIRYDMTEDEFWQQGGVARFIDKVASILKISHSTIRVISFARGSVIVNIEIEAKSQDPQTELDNFKTELNQAHSEGQLNVYQGAKILNFDQTAILGGDTQSENPGNTATTVLEEQSPLIYGLIAGAAVITVILAIFFVYKFRQMTKKSKMVAKIAPDVVTKIPSLKNQFKLLGDTGKSMCDVATPIGGDELAAFGGPDSTKHADAKKFSLQAQASNADNVENVEFTDQTDMFKPQPTTIATNLNLEETPINPTLKPRQLNRKNKPTTGKELDNEDDIMKYEV